MKATNNVTMDEYLNRIKDLFSQEIENEEEVEKILENLLGELIQNNVPFSLSAVEKYLNAKDGYPAKKEEKEGIGKVISALLEMANEKLQESIEAYKERYSPNSNKDTAKDPKEQQEMANAIMQGLAVIGGNLNIKDAYFDNYFDFSKLDLSHSRFSSTLFSNAKISDTNLEGGKFKNCTFTNSDFSKTNLSGSECEGVAITGCTFEGANLRGMNLLKSEINHSTFSNTGMQAVYTQKSDFKGCKFNDCDLSFSTFDQTAFAEVTIEKTKANACSFLKGTEFKKITISKSDLRRSKFLNPEECFNGLVNLSECDMRDVQAIEKIQELQKELFSSPQEGIKLSFEHNKTGTDVSKPNILLSYNPENPGNTVPKVGESLVALGANVKTEDHGLYKNAFLNDVLCENQEERETWKKEQDLLDKNEDVDTPILEILSERYNELSACSYDVIEEKISPIVARQFKDGKISGLVVPGNNKDIHPALYEPYLQSPQNLLKGYNILRDTIAKKISDKESGISQFIMKEYYTFDKLIKEHLKEGIPERIEQEQTEGNFTEITKDDFNISLEEVWKKARDTMQCIYVGGVDTDHMRVAWEFTALKYAVNHGIPILGICGGHQNLAIIYNTIDIQEEQGTLAPTKGQKEDFRMDQPAFIKSTTMVGKAILSQKTEKDLPEEVKGEVNGFHSWLVASAPKKFFDVTVVELNEKGKRSIGGIEQKLGIPQIGIQFHPEMVQLDSHQDIEAKGNMELPQMRSPLAENVFGIIIDSSKTRAKQMGLMKEIREKQSVIENITPGTPGKPKSFQERIKQETISSSTKEIEK